MRYRFLALGMMSVAAAVWMACSGDNTSTATSIGAEGQACLPGDQCIAGFECIDAICRTSAFGGSSDGGANAVGNPDATPNDCEDISQGPEPLCPTPDAGDALCSATDRFCCPGQGCQVGNAACNAPQGHFECFGTSQCQAVSNGHCCLTVSPDAGTACQPTTVTPGAGSTCTGVGDAVCGEFDIELCTSDTDCPANAPCTKTVLQFQGVNGESYTKTIGYCNVPPTPVEAGTAPPVDAGTSDAH